MEVTKETYSAYFALWV